MFIRRLHDPIVERIEKRISVFTHLPISHQASAARQQDSVLASLFSGSQSGARVQCSMRVPEPALFACCRTHRRTSRCCAMRRPRPTAPTMIPRMTRVRGACLLQVHMAKRLGSPATPVHDKHVHRCATCTCSLLPLAPCSRRRPRSQAAAGHHAVVPVGCGGGR